MPQQILNLSHKEPFAGTLHLASLVLYGLAQIWYCLLIVGFANVVVGVGVVPVLNGTEVHRVATHIANHVLSIISPTKLCVAFCEPSTSQSAHQRLTLI